MRIAPLAALLLAMAASAAPSVPRIERGNLVTEGVPEIPIALSARLEQYQETRSASFADWTHDGAMIISTRFGNTVQLHKVGRPLGARVQQTFFKEPITSARVNPDPKRRGFLYSRDRGGDEFFQLYWYDRADNEHRLLTDGKSRNTGAVWSNRGDRFAYSSTQRDGVNTDIWVGGLDQGVAARLLTKVAGSWSALDWSPDDASLLAQEFISVTESRLHRVDVASGVATELMPTEHAIAYSGAAFAKDGKSIFFVADDGSEFKTLRRLDLASGAIAVVSGHIAWDVEDFRLSDDGRWLAWTNNEDGIERLHLYDLKKGKEAAVPALPDGVLTGLGFSPDSQTIGLSLTTGASPSDAWALSLKTGKLERWTESEVGGLDLGRFAKPALVHFPTFDQVDGKPRQLPAFVYKPQGVAKAPVYLSIHGGPEGQSRPTFASYTQYLVNELGYAVVLPNVRGSTGYGKKFVALDNGLKREDSVKDIGALLDWIATQPDLDASRVVVYGGSYGGYMVLASLMHYSDRLAGGIDVVGISNFNTFLTNTQHYRRDLRRAEYGDERDPLMRAHFDKISPANFPEKIGKPLFVVQGFNDPRVPYTESEQMVAKIRARGGQVWYLLAKDEGHGFRKKANVDYQTAAMSLFLQQLAAPPAAPAPMPAPAPSTNAPTAVSAR
jgi:dipeptidyl aminopeptidase/acylaminoacyl peptidase